MARVQIPTDANRNAVQVVPAVVALEETYDATISSSTEITLNASTTFIEVTAIDKGIFMKWGTTDVSNSDFDEFIAAGQSRQYYVPRDTSGDLYTAVNFIEQAATAVLVMIEK